MFECSNSMYILLFVIHFLLPQWIEVGAVCILLWSYPFWSYISFTSMYIVSWVVCVMIQIPTKRTCFCSHGPHCPKRINIHIMKLSFSFPCLSSFCSCFLLVPNMFLFSMFLCWLFLCLVSVAFGFILNCGPRGIEIQGEDII